MMLLYKAWRESRARFLICAAVVAGICVMVVLLQKPARTQLNFKGFSHSYIGYVYQLVYFGSARGLFSLFAGVLGLGGLQKERSHGTAGFTLALPVGRVHLIAARAGVGLLEIVILSLLPAALVPTLSPLVHESYPLSQALQFSLLWFVCGAAGFAAWFLASTIFASEFTALVICFAVGILLGAAEQVGSLSAYHLSSNYIMSGFRMKYFNPQTSLLIGPLPWDILFFTALQALALLAAAAQITQKRDFW